MKWGFPVTDVDEASFSWVGLGGADWGCAIWGREGWDVIKFLLGSRAFDMVNAARSVDVMVAMGAELPFIFMILALRLKETRLDS